MIRTLCIIAALTIATAATAQSRSADPTGRNDRTEMIKTMVGQDPAKFETVMTPPFADGQMISCGPEVLMVSNMFQNGCTEYAADNKISFAYIDQENPQPDDSAYKYEFIDNENIHKTRYAKTLTRSVGDGEEELVVVTQSDMTLKLFGIIGEYEKTAKGPSTVGQGYEYAGLPKEKSYWLNEFLNHEWNNMWASPGVRDDSDEIFHGIYANHFRQNELWQAHISAQAVDLPADKRQGVILFVNNFMLCFDGDLNFSKAVPLPDICDGTQIITKKDKQTIETNTWGSCKADLDENGVDDILAICHTAGNKFYLVFLPDGSVENAKVVMIHEGDESWMNRDTLYYTGQNNLYYTTVDIADIYPHGEKAGEHNIIMAWWTHFRSLRDRFVYKYWMRSNVGKYTEIPVKEVMAWINGASVSDPIKDHEPDVNRYDLSKRTFLQSHGSLFRSPNLTVFYPRGRDHEAAFSVFDYIFNTMQVKDDSGQNLYLCDLSSVFFYDQDYQYIDNPLFEPYRGADPFMARIAGRPTVMKYAFDANGVMKPGETLVMPVIVRNVRCVDYMSASDARQDITNDIILYGASSASDHLYYTGNISAPYPENGDKYYDYGINVLRKFHTTKLSNYKPFLVSTLSRPKAVVELQESFFTATNPVIKTAIAVPPYDADIDRTNTHGYGVGIAAIEMEQETGKSEGTTVSSGTAWTAGGEFTLFEVLKLGGEYERDEMFSRSSEREISTTKSHGYTLTEEQDAIVYQYLPVDVFRYKAVSCKARPELEGKEMIFYITRGNSVAETMCTVEEYNKLIASTGAMQFDQALFPHKVGDLNNYRRCSSASTEAYIRSLFPVKPGGMFILGDVVSSSSGGETSTSLSMSDATSQGTSSTVTTSAKASFGLEWPVFSASTDISLVNEEEYAVTNSWGSSVGFSGSVPTAPMGDMYKFRQVWYEYENQEGDQNFLVGDWILVDYINREKPVSVNLEIKGEYNEKMDDGNYYSAAVLNWNIKNNKGVEIDHVELYYRMDGITPLRPYIDDDYDFLVTLDGANGDDWVHLSKSYDIAEDEEGNWHGVWNDFEACKDDETDTWYTIDWFAMTPAQYLSIIEANDYQRTKIHYKIKVYFIDGTEVEGETYARIPKSRTNDGEIEVYESPIASMVLYDGDDITSGSDHPTVLVPDKTPTEGEMFNLQGIPVGPGYKGVVIKDGKKILLK